MTLDLFKKLEDVKEEALHQKFLMLRDNPILFHERKIIESWTEGFVDRDNKIVKEFQTTFHSSFWEFYLFKVFKDSGFVIDFSYDSPDFIVKKPIEMNIEAVISNIRKDGKKETDRKLENFLNNTLPPHKINDFQEFLEESIIRHSNAIGAKSEKYLEKYRKKQWVKEDIPFVIALSSYGQIDYGREFHYPLLALLYGLYYDASEKIYKTMSHIDNPNSETNATIPLGIFNNSNFEHVSAIIFSCTLTLGKLTALAISNVESYHELQKVLNIRHDTEKPFYKIQIVSPKIPEELADGLMIFHNPYAKQKLTPDILPNTNIVNITFNERKLNVESDNLPLVARLNIDKYTFNNGLIRDIDTNYNDHEDISFD